MLAMLGVVVRWFLFDPVCVIERRDIFRSLKRSGVLTKGDRWRILVHRFHRTSHMGRIQFSCGDL
jgi:hypothetical protein